MDVEKPEVNVKPQEVPGKKRVAHEVKHTEVHACIQLTQSQCQICVLIVKHCMRILNITLTKHCMWGARLKLYALM